MLTRAERQEVLSKLSIAMSHEGDPRALVTTLLGVDGDPLLALVSSYGVTPPEFAAFFLDFCVTSEWTHNPALLAHLLNYLVADKGLGAFSPLLERVRQGVDPNPNAYHEQWLATSGPFFDRADLRAKVQQLLGQNKWTVLRIRSEPDSFGRSYSQKFLEHLEELSGDPQVLQASVTPGATLYTVTDLALDILLPFGISKIGDQTDSSLPKALARWVLSVIMAKAGRWVIVLDGFGQSQIKPSEDVRQMIEALAVLIPTGQIRRRVRLVLLDYQDPLPGVLPTDVLEEVLHPPGALSATDLVPTLTAWDSLRLANDHPGLAPAEIAKLADAIVQRAPAAGKARLEAMNLELNNLPPP